jgi:hypothetical protein
MQLPAAMFHEVVRMHSSRGSLHVFRGHPGGVALVQGELACVQGELFVVFRALVWWFALFA